jgi:hypothetical protein
VESGIEEGGNWKWVEGVLHTERFLKHIDAVDLVQRVPDHDLATLVGRAWRVVGDQ